MGFQRCYQTVHGLLQRNCPGRLGHQLIVPDNLAALIESEANPGTALHL